MAGIDPSKSPMSTAVQDSSSSKSKSSMSSTDEDSSSSKSKSPMSSTDESMPSSKAIGTEGGIEEDLYDDDIASDADTEEVLDHLFGNDPRQALSDDDFYDPGRRAMTDEESSAYAKQVHDSDGFDIRPYPYIDDSCRRITEFAIQRQTSYENKKLKLERVSKWNQQLASSVNYYITFEAEDVDTGEVETYQTKVEWGIPEEETEVAIFRVKPQPAEG